MTITRAVDRKGRLTLGPAYAGQLVIVRTMPKGRLEITPAVAVPADEAWLHKNKKALAAVKRGLDQAKRRQFVPGPRIQPDED